MEHHHSAELAVRLHQLLRQMAVPILVQAGFFDQKVKR